MGGPRSRTGWVSSSAAWLASWVNLPIDRGWGRATRPGWHRSVYRVAVLGLAVVGLLTVLAMSSWHLSDPDVATFVILWWAGLAATGLLLTRMLLTGVWTGQSGIRLEWLFSRRIIPWSQVAGLRVVPAPWSFGGRIERVVVETTDGVRVTVPGTDSYLHALFRADSPDKVRHALERERRYYVREPLPRRRRSRRPVIDLREVGEPASSAVVPPA